MDLPFSLNAPNLPQGMWLVLFMTDPSRPSGIRDVRPGVLDPIRNLIGDRKGLGRCVRCNRSWQCAMPGDGLPLNAAHDISPWRTGSGRFALCVTCEGETSWADRLRYDQIRRDIDAV